MLGFWEAVDKWEQSTLDCFLGRYPEYSGARIEVCDNGDVFVHGGAYPLIFRREVAPLADTV